MGTTEIRELVTEAIREEITPNFITIVEKMENAVNTMARTIDNNQKMLYEFVNLFKAQQDAYKAELHSAKCLVNEKQAKIDELLTQIIELKAKK